MWVRILITSPASWVHLVISPDDVGMGPPHWVVSLSSSRFIGSHIHIHRELQVILQEGRHKYLACSCMRDATYLPTGHALPGTQVPHRHDGCTPGSLTSLRILSSSALLNTPSLYLLLRFRYTGFFSQLVLHREKR